MTLDDKITQAFDFVMRMLGHYAKPCVLWSGGKDSMVLLHLVRVVARSTPDVVCWREPWMPQKQRFVNHIIDKWNLTVWDWHPETVTLAKGNGRVDILNHYSFGNRTITLARGTERPVEGEPWLCARDTFMARPRSGFPVPWDLAFHGHKSTDVDPLSGTVPLEVDVFDQPGVVATAFPLRDWTDEDIFAYTDKFSLPFDKDRYRVNDEGEWEVLPYQKYNPDYYPACVKCLDPDEGEFVSCPKLKARIQNISNHVVWQKPEMSYCNLNKKEEHAV